MVLMKKILCIAVAFGLLFSSCNRGNEDQPSKAERNMVKQEMTWKLDSILVIYNYMSPDEQSFMLCSDQGLKTWSYTFYPSKYNFPSDLNVVNGMTGDTVYLSEKYPENYCKYIHADEDGAFQSGGYMCYYNDKFALRGVKYDGTLEMRVVDANTDWDASVWTITYNPVEEDDGTILERRIEYYSRTK